MRADPLAFALLLPLLPAQQPPAGAPQFPADWDRRDLEARWVHYRDLSRVPAQLKPFVDRLAVLRDFELLEWIVIFDGWHGPPGSGAMAGDTLRRLDAPQWIRAATWSLGNSDSHGLDTARKALLGAAGRVHGWLREYPAAERLGLAVILEPIRAAEPLESGGALPPLDPDGVLLPFLDPPPRTSPFGTRLRAEPQVVYTHQVQRAIDGTITKSLFGAPWRDKLLRLARHADPPIARTALLAFTRYPAARVPWHELRTLASDADATEAQQRLATLAMTYSDAPEPWFLMHEWMLGENHPAISVLASRLLEIGDDYTATLFEDARFPGFTGAGTPRRRMIERAQRMRHETPAPAFERLVRRTAHAESTRRDAALAWGLEQIRGYPARGELRETIHALLADPILTWAPKTAEAVRRHK